MQPHVVVVDPLGTGQEYPGAFGEVGVRCVAVIAAPGALDDPYWRASWHPGNFAATFVFDGDLERLVAELREYRPLCVIPGAETGVELADVLCERLTPGTGNVPALTAARRDKWAMAEAVRAAGLPHLAQTCADTPEAVAGWLRDTGLAARRIVLKPPKSSGTDEVHLVPAGADWRPSFDRILGQVNELGFRNDAVLVQEFAEGTEYLVDSYSVDGRHGLVDVCRYTKGRRGDRIGVYELVDFLPPDAPDVLAVWPYVTRVLDAVGVRNGCGHTEVVLTVDGPRLLEVGARPAGGGHQMITELATGTNHIRRTVDHRVCDRFAEGYRLVRHVCSVVLHAPRAGVWRDASVFDEVPSLPTYHAHHFYFGGGDVLPEPAGLSSMLGWVVLASTDRAAMEADHRRIRDMERRIVIDAEHVTA